MTAIRRIALVIVLVLLVLDCVALGLVKLGGGSPGTFNLTALVDKVDQAKKVKAALEKEGFKVADARADKKTQVLDGYRVLIDNPAAVQPMYETLRHEKVPVKKSKDGNELQLAKTFKNKRLAQQAAGPLQKYGFKVAENYKNVTIKAYQLTLKDLSDADADKAEAIFDEHKVQVERDSVPKKD